MKRKLKASTNLRDRSAWSQMRRNGFDVLNTIITDCGRYTVVRYPARPMVRERYMAFRRRGPPEMPNWSPPYVIGGFDTADAARASCALHAEQEAANERQPVAV